MPILKPVFSLQREVKIKVVTYGIVVVLLAGLLTAISFNLGVQPAGSQLKTFSSHEELENFLRMSRERAKTFPEWYLSPFLRGLEAETLDQGGTAAPAYSTTNIQVAGVDEADVVKTDGEYLYVVSGANIYILRAYPPEQARVLSKLTLNETYGLEIYVDGDKLAVLGKHYGYALVRTPYAYPEEAVSTIVRAPYVYSEEAFIKVYDISDRAAPVLTRAVSLNGTLSGSRMIDNYVYVVVNQPAVSPSRDESDLKVALPKVFMEDGVEEIQPTEIHYVNVPDVFYYFTTVVAVDIVEDVQKPTYESFLTGATANMYVSQGSMYLAVPNMDVWMLSWEAVKPREETLIYRVKLAGEKIVSEAQGSVSGRVLNQFSMDEYGSFFRIATTEGWGEGSVNNLFVLDMSLNIVGRLEGLAPTERIYSARFMGDRCYLVTFRQVDPFFVIDLSNPVEPGVLGYLKIPGFSGYLHPYDENYVIGIGREGSNVKLSLFDVTDVTSPVETAKFVVQGGWSDTPVLADHKAFLFDKSKQLLALPVLISWIAVRGEYYKGFWQGEYVFNISAGDGFVLKGEVTHQENDMQSSDSNYSVRRALYIDNGLYTVSNKKVKVNSLEDLGLLKEIKLG